MFGENDLIWLYLSLKSGLKRDCLYSLYLRFGSAEAIIGADYDELYETGFVNKNQILDIKGYSPDSVIDVTDELRKHDIKLLAIDNEAYPENLRSIGDPPLVLYYKGRLLDINSYICIASVGTRMPTAYGKRHAYSIARGVSESGCIIVSGLAIGIDTLSHEAALDAGMPTVAFVANGLDIVYPKENEKLAQKIMKTGMIISEYPPGTPPSRYRFPERNRLISGISQGVFLSEANVRSGSSLTCASAIVQDRDVFALPGSIDSSKSREPNRLIKSGAYAVLGAEDIINHYYSLYGDNMKLALERERVHSESTPKLIPLEVPKVQIQENIPPSGLSNEEKVMFVLKKDTLSIDAISALTKITLGDLNMILLMLEMDGRIGNDNGNYFAKEAK